MANAADQVKHLNNIGLIRLVLAVLVLFSHCFPLAASNHEEPLWYLSGNQMTFGSMAVNVFFLLSGYLIAKSWVRSPSAGQFVIRRLLRVYPGYLVAFAVSAGVGPLSATPGLMEYARRVYLTNERVLRSILFLLS